MKNKQFYSVLEIARLLGISRIAVFNKIKKGEIKAMKIGRSYAIPQKEVSIISGLTISDKDKVLIERAVKKTVSEYGETLRLLGKE